ncbi:unnamed protein product, partial [Closterium sp. NIES-64]
PRSLSPTSLQRASQSPSAPPQTHLHHPPIAPPTPPLPLALPPPLPPPPPPPALTLVLALGVAMLGVVKEQQQLQHCTGPVLLCWQLLLLLRLQSCS